MNGELKADRFQRRDVTLETMRPNPAWDRASYEDAVETFETYADRLTVRVWAADWCPDCRRVLPDFAAALDAAGIPEDRIEVTAVDRDKQGPGVEEYGIEYVPTIVLEINGEAVARFVESESLPPAVSLAEQLRD